MNRNVWGMTRRSLLALAVSVLMPLQAVAQPTSHTIFGLVQGTNELIRFNSATPGTIDATIPITGLAAGETLRGIDFRPATG